jgi:hypothetical protein
VFTEQGGQAQDPKCIFGRKKLPKNAEKFSEVFGTSLTPDF